MNIQGEIQQYLGGDDYAQLRFSESHDAFSVDTILVPSRYRSQGIGGNLIRHILNMADACDKPVYLTARPIGTSGAEAIARLVRYYGRFGFTVLDEGSTVSYMMRSRRSERPGTAA